MRRGDTLYDGDTGNAQYFTGRLSLNVRTFGIGWLVDDSQQQTIIQTKLSIMRLN